MADTTDQDQLVQERIELTKKISALLKGQKTFIAKEIIEDVLKTIDYKSIIVD